MSSLTTWASPISSNISSKTTQQLFPPKASAVNVTAKATHKITTSSQSNGTSSIERIAQPDEERHNYTNDLLVPGTTKLASATIEKPQRQSKNLSSDQRPTIDANSDDNYTAESKNLLTAMSAAVSVSADDVVSERELNPGAQSSESLNAGAISGICVAALALCSVVSAAAIVAYRRRFVNKPQALSEPDSSGYIDDSTIRVSRNGPQFQKSNNNVPFGSIYQENSDEMYSLDNDSFLNSLEAMTIQNYWTENVKHTKL